jgi:hypothetical protein
MTIINVIHVKLLGIRSNQFRLFKHRLPLCLAVVVHLCISHDQVAMAVDLPLSNDGIQARGPGVLDQCEHLALMRPLTLNPHTIFRSTPSVLLLSLSFWSRAEPCNSCVSKKLQYFFSSFIMTRL